MRAIDLGDNCTVKSSYEFTSDDTARYSRDHTWGRIEDYHIAIGITDFAQDQLGEIIYIKLPELGALFKQHDVFGFVESVKTASDLNIPVGGKVIAVNYNLADSPELVNKEPYAGGWLIKVLPSDLSEMNTLLAPHEYLEMLKSNSGRAN